MTVLCLPSDELIVDDTPKSASLHTPVLSASMLPPARARTMPSERHKQANQKQAGQW